jgi:hypothetical protein
MATKKSMFVLFGILSISVWILGSAIQVGAETLNYKAYTYVTKGERVPIDDVEGHTMGFQTRKAFCVFENGEVATQNMVLYNDLTKGSGPSLMYSTLTFADGSTIIMKVQVTVETVAGSSAAKMTREIIKGTGRFEGIKGTGTTNIKYLPVEKDEAGAKGYGEGTIIYTLPSK